MTESYLQGLTRQIPGLNFSRWMSDRTDGAFAAQITADRKRALAYGITGTPTLVATGPEGSAMVTPRRRRWSRTGRSCPPSTPSP